MAHPGDVLEIPVFGARVTFLQTAEQTNGESLRVEVILPPGFSVSEHVHPDQEERHQVLHGTLRGRVGGQERDYGEGEEAVGPPGCRTPGATPATAKPCAWFPSTGRRCTRKRCWKAASPSRATCRPTRGALWSTVKRGKKRPYCHFAQPKTRDLDPSSYLPNSF